MYKNWDAIFSINDYYLKLAFSFLDLSTELGQKIAQRLPEYFSGNDLMQPIPLSVFKFKANTYRDGTKNPENFLISSGAIPADWPILNFGDELALNTMCPEYEPIPAELKWAKKIGAIFHWQGKKIILVEYHVSEEFGKTWYFVPAELINVEY